MSASGSPELEVAGEVHLVLEPKVLGPVLEKGLPSYLCQRRWFRSKSREIVEAKIRDRLLLPLDATGGLASEKVLALALFLIEVRFRSGPEEEYHLPLAVLRGEARAGGPSALLQLYLGPRREAGVLCDALEDPESALILLESLEKRTTLEGMSGKASLERTRGFEPRPYAVSQVRSMGAEQSNSSVVFGDHVVLKVLRKVEPGVNPEVEISRFLTLKGFHHAPRLHLSLEYAAGRLPATLLLLQEFVPSVSDGWNDALSHVRSFYDKPSSEELDAYGVLLEGLGRATGELHEALASDADDPAFRPERVEAADVAAWAASLRDRLDRVTRLLESRFPGFLELRSKIEEALGGLERLKDLGKKTRHHGDYHLGQALRTRKGWVLLDFEGEPARSLEERRAKHSPLRDVAGMLRSFSYAAYAALFERCSPESSEWARLEPQALAWESQAREAFLRGYRSSFGGSGILPSMGMAREKLLSFLELEKAVYELHYELDNRPDWVRIPMRGIERLINRSRA